MVSLPSILGGSDNKEKEFDVEAVLATLTLAEKISLLGGKVSLDLRFGGWWYGSADIVFRWGGWDRISGIRSIFLKRGCLPFEFQMDPTESEESR
jgi:hypothetical protein